MRWIVTTALVVAGVAVTGCGIDQYADQGSATSTAGPAAAAPPGATAATGRAPAPQAVAIARTELAKVAVTSIPREDSSYQRDAFGDAWSDAAVGVVYARNGCDTRNDVLKRDAMPGTVRIKANTHNCKVLGGRWTSPYTGRVLTSTRSVQIDHVVPLGRAWAAGAKSWDAQRRLAFANDPDNLMAVDGSSNQSKGDKGPSAWRPKQPFQCAYAVHYLYSTTKYRLPVSPSDRAALGQMLGTCPR